jgi:hypothetical protein
MAKQFTIEHLSAGKWMKGEVVTDEQVKAGGFDLDHWLKVKAVKEVPPATVPVVEPVAAAAPAPVAVAPVAAAPAK